MKNVFPFVLCVLIACSTNKSENISAPDSTELESSGAENGIAQQPEKTDAAIQEEKKNVEAPGDACGCNVDAYLSDPDPDGTNIRETPNGKIMGQLHYESDCDCLTVSFVESKNGWMKLSDGGWVLGKLFSVDTRNYGEGQKVYLQEFPTEESKVVAEFDKEQNFKVKGCCGTWLQVEDGSGTTGWLTADMICANPLTNCS
jgi:SH3-like domain-containing protein